MLLCCLEGVFAGFVRGAIAEKVVEVRVTVHGTNGKRDFLIQMLPTSSLDHRQAYSLRRRRRSPRAALAISH